MSLAGKRRQVQINRRARLGNMPDGVVQTAFSSFQPNRGFPMAFSPPQFGLSSSIPTAHMSYPQSPVGTSMSSDDGRAGKFIFKNTTERTIEHQYPSVVFNGQLQDVNDVVKAVVLQREPAPAVFDGSVPSPLCPLSRVPITCPARGVHCNHSACFDLRQFLLLRPGDGAPCPICNQPLRGDDLRFDPQFFVARQRRQSGSDDIGGPFLL